MADDPCAAAALQGPYADAVASARLEGVEPTAETLALLRQMRAGDITVEDAVAIIMNTYK